jgi:hypothetical protein
VAPEFPEPEELVPVVLVVPELPPPDALVGDVVEPDPENPEKAVATSDDER